MGHGPVKYVGAMLSEMYMLDPKGGLDEDNTATRKYLSSVRKD